MEGDSIKRMFALYYENAKVCAEEVVKRLREHEDQDSLLADLREAVKKVNAFENTTRKESAALDAIEHEINNQNEDSVPSGDIAEMLREKLAQTKSSKNWTGALNDFDAHIKKAQDDLELEDMIVEESDNQIDPYSKKPIEHPVRTKFCNHAFDKTTVLALLAARGKHGQLRCPYMGCNKRFTANDLVDLKEKDAEEDSE